MSSRGTQRENDVKDWLEEQGWWVCRAAGSLGDADLAAMTELFGSWFVYLNDHQTRGKLLVEVKSTKAGPFSDFGPADRAELLAAGEKAGADVVLVWCPPGRRAPEKWRWIWPDEWPRSRMAA